MRPAQSIPSLFVMLSAFAIGCAPPAIDDAEDSGNAIIGGDSARGGVFEAVVALVEPEGDGFWQFCTGTLVAPRVVVTAEHCTEGLSASNVRIAFGEDLRKPTDVRKVKEIVTVVGEPRGGLMGYGSDVSFVVLDKAVDAVKPIPMLTRALRSEDLGKSLLAVGYGTTSPTRDREPIPKGYTKDDAKRHMAPEVITAVAGGLEITPPLEARIDAWLEEHGYPAIETLRSESPPRAVSSSSTLEREDTMSENYEALVLALRLDAASGRSIAPTG